MVDTHADATTAKDVLAYWHEIGPAGWYKQDDEIDQAIRERFGQAWEQGAAGTLRNWSCTPDGALALLILLDQFPRNMFRNSSRAFATDSKALEIACYAIDRGWDLRTDLPMRQFFYMPFMHSERLTDQDHCVRLMAHRSPDNLLHARAHREIIRQFNRFPYRNAALGRSSTPAEQVFLTEGGYGKIVRELQGEDGDS